MDHKGGGGEGEEQEKEGRGGGEAEEGEEGAVPAALSTEGRKPLPHRHAASRLPAQVWPGNHPGGISGSFVMQIRGAQPRSIQFRILGSLYAGSILRTPPPALVASQRQHCPVTEVGFGKFPKLEPTMPSTTAGLEDPQVFSFQTAAPWPGGSWGRFSGSSRSGSRGPAGQPRAPTQGSDRRGPESGLQIPVPGGLILSG